MRTFKNLVLATIIILSMCKVAHGQQAETVNDLTVKTEVKTDSQKDYKVVNGEVVKIQKETVRKEPIKTELTHTINKGKANEEILPLYKGARGGYYILRTSKKSGKQYKQYFKLQF